MRETRAGRKGAGAMAIENQSRRVSGFRRSGASPRQAHAASRDPTNPVLFFPDSRIPRRRVQPPRRATATAYPSRSPRSLPPSERATESSWSHHRHHAFLALSFALACTCGAFLWGHRATVFRLGASQLGPGPGEWLVEDPRVHGLSSAKLASAAERHARELDQRDCLLVVKDGVIVHETYREGGDADTLHYLDGVGRAAAALLIGAAEHQGVLDLDTPLSEYGIAAPPVREYGTSTSSSGVDAEALAAHPELRWGDEWSRVTARHVLGQATGLGEARAGETFDARVTDEILDVLSQVLRATTGLKPAEWAKEHFTGPLGVPDFFARDVGADGVADGGVRVAGGQMATCRDAARFGQLLINRGEWLGEDGTSTRLVRADFVRRVVNPSFPRAAAQRGYQTWTHPGKTASGAPRATPFFAEVRSEPDLGATETNATSSPTTLRAPVWADYASSGASPACGADAAADASFGGAFLGPAGPSFPLAFAVGRLGKFLVVSPETSTVLVSMGNTWGSDKARCPSGLRELLDGAERARRSAEAAAARLGLAPGTTVGYDEAVLMRQLWHAVGDAVTPAALGAPSAESRAASSVSQIGAKRVAETKKERGEANRLAGDGAAVALGDYGAYAREKASARRAVAAAANATRAAAVSAARHPDDYEAPAAEERPEASASRERLFNDEKSALAAAQRQDAFAAARAEQAERLVAATGAEAAARVRRRGVDALGQLGDDRDADPNGGRTGSCRCACPPAADGVGQCVNMRGVPEASCNDVALLGGARGFCPALGVTSTCAVPPGPAAQTRGALGGSERGRHGRHERGRRDGKKSGGRRSLRETAAAFVDDDDEDAPVTAVTVKISAARFGDPSALDDPWSRLGGADSKITRVDPESPAFECASSRACAPGLGGERTESFLCQPLTFVSCSWSDELCDQRSTRDATRRATKAPTADDHLTKNVALRLTEPSVPTYLGLKAANAAGTTAPPRVRLGIVPTDRAAVAAFAAAATAMLAGAVRLARGAARPAGAPHKRARSRAEAGETTELLGEANKAKDAAADVARQTAAPAAAPAAAPPETPAPPKARLSPESTPPRASASKPPLPPKDRTPPRRPTADVGGDRKEKQAPPAPPVLAEDAAGSAVVEPGEGAESVDMNSDDEIDAWLAD